jgi:Holliday junction resolvasome RuvABC ATP-dependent DNA helicase subunit
MCIPRDLGVGFQIASGAALMAPKDLIPYLTNAEERSVLFIDEIHRLPKAVEEFLYPAMEDFRIDLTLGEGVNARTINMSLRPFTLIGATTRTGLLSAPLRDRFQMREHLDFYTVEQLAEIVSRNAKKLRVQIVDKAAAEIAGRSRGVPTTGCGGSATTPRAKPTGRSPFRSPATPWRCRASTRWGSTRRTGSIWRRLPACSSAGRWASRPWRTQ